MVYDGAIKKQLNNKPQHKMEKKGMKLFHWLLSIVIFLALINYGTLAVWNFDLLGWITFGSLIAVRILYGVVTIVGLLGLISLIMKK